MSRWFRHPCHGYDCISFSWQPSLWLHGTSVIHSLWRRRMSCLGHRWVGFICGWRLKVDCCELQSYLLVVLKERGDEIFSKGRNWSDSPGLPFCAGREVNQRNNRPRLLKNSVWLWVRSLDRKRLQDWAHRRWGRGVWLDFREWA